MREELRRHIRSMGMEDEPNDILDQRTHDLIARSMAGDLSSADADAVGELASALLGRSDGFEMLREVVLEERMLSALRQRMRGAGETEAPLERHQQEQHVTVPLSGYRRRQDRAAGWRGSALQADAILLLVTAVAAGGGVRAVRRWMRGSAPPATRTVVTRDGQRDTVHLPDGSEAILAPGTTLRYTIAASTGVRELRLDGQAVFSVRHDTARPFRVQTARALIEDLGTTFAVREYAADTVVRVAVRTGAVSVHTAAAPGTTAVTLHQGEAARVEPGGTVVRLAGSDSAAWAWTAGRLVFDNTPLSDVLAELQRWYAVEFQLEDSTVLRQHVTGAFQSAAPLSEVLDILGPIVHARFDERGRVVTVTSRRGP